MEEQYIVIEDTRFYHGDKISAVVIYRDTDFKIEDARLCINNFDKHGNDYGDDIVTFYICQNDCDGDCGAEEKFGYMYSWIVKVNRENKRICSSDTSFIILKEKNREEDDDPMPEDWICEEKFPIDI